MRVLMIPGLGQEGDRTTGISAVVHKYVEYLPKHFDVKFVKDDPDIIVSHAGITGKACDVSVLHGIYWTGDYNASRAEYAVNAKIADSVRSAKQITVPSHWVKKTIERDLRLSPHVIPHGIEWEEWQGKSETKDYILWNKNRLDRICDPTAMQELAKLSPEHNFLTTFAIRNNADNVKVIGKQSFDDMKVIVKEANIYLSLVKETFGIGVLEALASGVPVLGWDYGGNQELIEHCVNGYLAEPFNYEDLQYGLEYCLEHRDVLGRNARETAKKWKWIDAVSKLYDVLKLANTPKDKSVSVIIPTYNYADKLPRVLDSIKAQTLKPAEIIIVDDGSTKDNPREVIDNYTKEHDINIKFIRQENSGVAIARNTGFKNATSEYICCIDPDDKIEPEFLDVCVDYLEKNPFIYTAYTRLQYIKPDGETGISSWPSEYDFDRQLKRVNQVPTCNVSRRAVWERLGGQRSRYSPVGAGSEDAEMWTRAGAHGMGAELASNKALFVYSWMSGIVSGNKDYQEVDWLGMHPWVKDGIHPLASFATPKNKLSHPVFQYDEAEVSIIIPVAEKHLGKLVDCLDSIEGQEFRRWEIVVVDDSESKIDDFTKKAYPFVTWLESKTPRSGAGACRNLGVKHATADSILFLDADDELAGSDALKKMMTIHQASGDIVYADYIIRFPPSDDPERVYGERYLYSDKVSKDTFILGRALPYNCKRAQEEIDYNWCIISCIIPKHIHKKVNGFDEKLSLLEDVDYHKRIAKLGYCYTKINSPTVIVDRKRDSIHEKKQSDIDHYRDKIKNKLKRIKNMPCRGCGSSKVSSELAEIYSSAYSDIMKKEVNNMSYEDNDFVRCKYMSRMSGDHRVTGQNTKIDYGYRNSGDTILVHRNDVDNVTFIPVEEQRPKIFKKDVEEKPAPDDIIKKQERAGLMIQPITEEALIDLGVTRGADKIVESLAGIGIMYLGQLPDVDDETLLSLDGIGVATAKKLKKVLE